MLLNVTMLNFKKEEVKNMNLLKIILFIIHILALISFTISQIKGLKIEPYIAIMWIMISLLNMINK